MKNLLLTTVLILAVIFSSNATNDVNGPAKKVSISGAGATFPLPFYNLAFKTYQDKTPSPTGASVVVAVFVA